MISLVIFGVAGYVSSLAIENLTIELWVIILIASLAGALLSLLYFRPYTESARQFSIKSLILGLIPYLVLLPGVIALLISTDIQISYHGPFHSGYIYQILNGISPPENVVLPEYPANVYWLFHALIATLTYIFKIAPPLISALVNMGALIGSLYWIRKSLSLLELKNKNSLITSGYSLLILFSTNIFGSLHSVLNYFIRWEQTQITFFESIRISSILAGSEYRISCLLRKFLNFNGTPLGVLYYCFAIYLSLLILQGKLSTRKFLLLAVAISGALIYHTTSGLFALLLIPLSLLITLLYTRRNTLFNFICNTNTSEWLILIVFSIVLFIPEYLYVSSAARALPAETHFGTLVLPTIVAILVTAYPIMVLSLLAIFTKYKEKTTIILFFGFLGTAGYLLSVMIDLPDKNQYKFIYLSTISLSFLSVLGLNFLLCNSDAKIRNFGRIILTFTFILLGFSIIFVGINYHSTRYPSENDRYYTNSMISLKEGVPFRNTYDWIRDNSTSDTVIIMPLPDKNKSDLYLVAQRLPYVAYGDIFAEGFNEYDKRVENVNQFYSQNTPIDKKVEILGEFEKFSKKRDAILLIPSENLEPISAYLDNFVLIYSGRDAKLYSFPNN